MDTDWNPRGWARLTAKWVFPKSIGLRTPEHSSNPVLFHRVQTGKKMIESGVHD